MSLPFVLHEEQTDCATTSVTASRSSEAPCLIPFEKKPKRSVRINQLRGWTKRRGERTGLGSKRCMSVRGRCMDEYEDNYYRITLCTLLVKAIG